jgi:hypothetical protein
MEELIIIEKSIKKILERRVEERGGAARGSVVG